MTTFEGLKNESVEYFIIPVPEKRGTPLDRIDIFFKKKITFIKGTKIYLKRVSSMFIICLTMMVLAYVGKCLLYVFDGVVLQDIVLPLFCSSDSFVRALEFLK